MQQYIKKDALVAEIENKIEKYFKRGEESDAKRDGYGMYWGGVLSCLNEIRTLCDSLEVKEVDLEKELESWRHNHFHGRRDKEASGEYLERVSQLELAKHFIELGMAVSNPITAADRGMVEEIIINLKRVEQDYRIDLTKEIKWVRNKAQKGE